MHKSFVTAKRLAGIKDLRFHDLRRCYITRMSRAGMKQVVIMAITGHATDAMFRRYRKVADEDLDEVIEVARRRQSDEQSERRKMENNKP